MTNAMPEPMTGETSGSSNAGQATNEPAEISKASRGAVEAMLFVSDEPVAAPKLADMLDLTVGQVDTILCALQNEYEEQERGMQLREVAGGWRLYTHPAYHEVIERYVLSWDTHKLSQAALEALAVIAYNQPTTRAVVSSIRGVNSDAVVSSLVEKGLIREAGRENTVGQPILYATTRAFLEKFGLRSIKDLPPLEDFAANEQTRQLIMERLSSAVVADIVDDGAQDARGGDGQDGGEDIGTTADGEAAQPAIVFDVDELAEAAGARVETQPAGQAGAPEAPAWTEEADE